MFGNKIYKHHLQFILIFYHKLPNKKSKAAKGFEHYRFKMSKSVIIFKKFQAENLFLDFEQSHIEHLFPDNVSTRGLPGLWKGG